MTAPLLHETEPAQTRFKWLVISGLVLASFGLVTLGLCPNLDVAASAIFFSASVGFVGSGPIARHLRFFAAILPFIAYGTAFLAYFGGLTGALSRRFKLSLRNLIFLTATFVLGPGLLVNEGFKAHMHRPRPVHMQGFGGEAAFRPFYRPDGDCAKNCSFPSGETAAAFWMMAPAALAPLPWRAGAIGLALLFGIATGALRIAAGAHFLSDVLFSGWLMSGLVIVSWYLTRTKPMAALHEDQASL